MKKSEYGWTIGLSFVALSLVVKAFSSGGAFSDFFQGAFIGLGLAFLASGFVHSRKKAKMLC
jgi:hypothetical protein